MIKHIVMWNLKSDIADSEKEEKKQEIRTALEDLKEKISEIKSIRVFFNSPDAPSANHEIVLNSEFNSINDLNAYQVHPEHKKVVAFVKGLLQDRVAIDYEF
jgi:protein subunit release factor B